MAANISHLGCNCDVDLVGKRNSFIHISRNRDIEISKDRWSNISS